MHTGIASAVICTAQLMVIINACIVNVALPSIQQALDFSPANLVWVVNGYVCSWGRAVLGWRGVVAIVEALAQVASNLGARGDDIAAARRLPDHVVAVLRQAGAFRIAAPRALGGPELTPREQTEVIETLSRHEASVGWCAMIGSDAPYYGSFLAPDAAAELWPSIDAITAGQIPPNGQARRVEDGYVINGRWA
jgi:hypothetical protein